MNVEALKALPPRELLATLEKLYDHRRFRRVEFFKPYPKQMEFFALSKDKTEILLMAGNQLGKSEAGAVALSYHLTGLYPDWWPGRRWNRPIKAWACGESSADARDIQQKKLCGEPAVADSLGTGFLPKDCIADVSLAKGISDAFDTVTVKHHTNGIHDGYSTLKFKSYEQGRKKHQGETLDLVWDDEEPPEDIFVEHLARLSAQTGLLIVTFTPLQGATQVVDRFTGEAAKDKPGRGMIRMGIKDAGHMTPDKVKSLLDAYPPWQHKARLEGLPLLGSGAVFPISEDRLRVSIPLKDVPLHWAKLWGVDFGIGHAFAAVLLAWDRDADRVYVLHELKMEGQIPVHHVAAMRQIAADVPVAWPHDGNSRDKGSGIALANLYKAPHVPDGLKMRGTHAQFRDGTYSTEAGVTLTYNYMAGDRFKVNENCIQWWEEFRRYHRKDGQIVKIFDDLMSATRIAMMDLRYARPMPLGGRRRLSGGEPEIAQDMDAWLEDF